MPGDGPIPPPPPPVPMPPPGDDASVTVVPTSPSLSVKSVHFPDDLRDPKSGGAMPVRSNRQRLLPPPVQVKMVTPQPQKRLHEGPTKQERMEMARKRQEEQAQKQRERDEALAQKRAKQKEVAEQKKKKEAEQKKKRAEAAAKRKEEEKKKLEARLKTTAKKAKKGKKEEKKADEELKEEDAVIVVDVGGDGALDDADVVVVDVGASPDPPADSEPTSAETPAPPEPEAPSAPADPDSGPVEAEVGQSNDTSPPADISDPPGMYELILSDHECEKCVISAEQVNLILCYWLLTIYHLQRIQLRAKKQRPGPRRSRNRQKSLVSMIHPQMNDLKRSSVCPQRKLFCLLIICTS